MNLEISVSVWFIVKTEVNMLVAWYRLRN